MKTYRQNLGKTGEDLAVRYLQQKGYEILRRNYRIGKAEIDIIAMDRDDLVIAEVKSIRTLRFGRGEEHVTKRKKTILIMAAYGFLDIFPLASRKNLRFDVLVIDFSCFPAAIEHYQSAFWQRTEDLPQR